MLNTASPLNRTALGSALAGQSRLRPQGNRRRRMLTAGLMLTSLVDAFSILVIFLIMNTGANTEAVNVSQTIQLPQSQASQIIDAGITVRIEKGQFFVEDKQVELGQLPEVLKTLNQASDEAKKEGLIIVADRNLDYSEISPVILAGSHSGFTKFKFVVIQK